MTRLQALFTAGGLTGLVLIALFWWGRTDASAADALAVPTTPVLSEIAPVSAPVVAPEVHQQVLDENAQLRNAIDTLMERETQYRQQIETANQRLQAVSAQQTAAEPASTVDSGATGQTSVAVEETDYEQYEHEAGEHEYEAHEHEDDD